MLVQSVPTLVCRADLRYRATESPEFIDITADVEAMVLESGITPRSPEYVPFHRCSFPGSFSINPVALY